ncbi:MAG: LamG domain-containing protein [Akkermansiaceae bacterium]|nr:LamG domain-containing protein [Akkermansiaceae bacterium]
MRTRRFLAAILLVSQLPAQETAKLTDVQPAPVFAEAVTDTVATGANLPRLIETVIAPAPAPVPAVKPYTPAPADLREAKTIEQGGRQITYQRIEPLPIPPPPEPVPQPTAAERAAFSARAAALRASRPRERFILLGGTLYLSDNRPPRAFCRQWPVGGGEPVSFWTNIDLRDIQGLGRFVGTDGTHYQFMMMWTVMDLSRIASAWSANGRAYLPPELPDFPNETPAAAGQPATLTGAATFIPVCEGADKANDLTIITELHKIYNQERPRLHAAAISRENARLAAEAALKANPPKPQDITLHYWFKTTAPQVPADPAPPADPAVPPPSAPSTPKPRRPRRTRPEESLPGCQGRRASSLPPSASRSAFSRTHIISTIVALAAHILTIQPASAIWDTNGNGVSDAWELNTNNGQLLPVYTPGADPDSDGWTNEDEAAAGTHPGNSVPPAGLLLPESRLTPETYILHEDGTVETVPESIVLTWTGIPGKRYTLQHSVDLVTWTSVGDAVISDGTAIEAGVAIGDSSRHFLRVRVDDYDSDNDDLSDYEELRLGTHQDSSDTDGDGKSDHYEANNPALYDPLDPDQDLDGILDGVDGSPRSNNVAASPDSAGLIDPATGDPTSLLSSMAGRWDLEAIETVGGASVFKDSTAGGRHATPVSILSADPEGMISKCARTNTLPAAGSIHVPASLLDNKTYYSVSFWANIEAGSVRNNPGRLTGLHGHSQYMPFTGQTPYNWACLTIETNGIWFEMKNGVSRLHAGRYSYVNHINGVPHTPSIATYGIDTPRTLDDGVWHHYLMTMSSAVVTLYIDGVQVGSESYTNPAITGAPFTTVSLGRLYGPDPTLSPVPPAPVDNKTRGRLDRFRVWHTVLTPADALTLFREDADHDGLWDITEAASSLWRDTNSDAIRTASEVAFYVDPFRCDPPGKDHDRDGITSINEQSLGTGIYDADSDDDGIPDGYDQLWCAGAKTPDANLQSDADSDGLTLEMEIAYGTKPNNPDSDGDETPDGSEYAQGSHPNDASDGGQPPAAGTTIPMKLAVGDQSGSDSEDYHLVAYRYDPETKQEAEVYRLRSGGFGQYSGEKTVSGVFRADETYTFRIQWQGSNLGFRSASQGVTAEGPDFDYTMIVEPATPVPGLVIEDAITPATGDLYPGPGLTGNHSDVTTFPVVSYEAAVEMTKTYIDLAVDANNDGYIDSLPDASDKIRTLAKRLPLDRTYENSVPPRGAVIDINNDNDNQDVAPDNANNIVDSASDRLELDGAFNEGKQPGHALGRLRVMVWPQKGLRDGTLGLRLVHPAKSGVNIVRVFDWQDNGHGWGDKPVELAMQENQQTGAASATLDTALFLNQPAPISTKVEGSYRDLLLEGLTYGNVKLRLELYEKANPDTVIDSDEVTVTVNVDQCEAHSSTFPNASDALPIRGMAPHYAGIHDQSAGGTAGRIRAVTGRITCRVPSFKSSQDQGFHTQLSPMHNWPLRRHVGDGSSGQSFWVGVKQNLPDGNFTWAQCGLRWSWDPGDNAIAQFSTPPAGYVETGTMLNRKAYFGRTLVEAGTANNRMRALLNWHQVPLVIDFLLWKEIVSTNGDGSDSKIAAWKVIFKDSRDGKPADDSAYYVEVVAPPARPASGNDATLVNTLDAIYNAQNMNLLDAKMECNNSVSFAVGSSTQKAMVSNLKVASGLIDDPEPEPQSGQLDDRWNWMQNSYEWQPVQVNSEKVGVTVRNGKNSGTAAPGDAAAGTALHPYWHTQAGLDGFSLWDDRPWAFGEIQIDPAKQQP